MWLNAARIAKVLRRSGMSRNELARLLGVSESEAAALINGEDCADMEAAEKLLQLFGAKLISYAVDWTRTRGAVSGGRA